MKIDDKHMKPRYLLTLTVFADTTEEDLKNIIMRTERLEQVFEVELTEIK